MVESCVFIKIKEGIENAKFKGFEFHEICDTELEEQINSEELQGYISHLDQLKKSNREEVNWNQTVELIKQEKAMASGERRIQLG